MDLQGSQQVFNFEAVFSFEVDSVRQGVHCLGVSGQAQEQILRQPCDVSTLRMTEFEEVVVDFLVLPDVVAEHELLGKSGKVAIVGL